MFSTPSERSSAPAVDMVFLDIGGVIYSDHRYRDSLKIALRQLGADFTDQEFDAEYTACRRDQAGSFRRRFAERFLDSPARSGELEAVASEHWRYRTEDLYPDVRATLEELAGRYRLGILANQPSAVRAALERDGIDHYFDVWGVSEDLGLSKPDPRLFRHALDAAGSEPARTIMVGDRLDYDIRPAKGTGMRTVWLLRGEAPDEPTAEQLREPDLAIRSLAELPAVLERL
jgi:HAD superfamily hydrolase (TIGR01549 family)